MRVYQFKGKEAILTKVAALYNEGATQEIIASEIGKSRVLVSLYLKHLGIQTRKGPARKIRLNEDFFQIINTHQKAYWLGFFLADGYVSARTLRIELKRSDESHLEELIKDFDGGHSVQYSVRHRNGKEHRAARVVFSSARLVRSVEEKGWHEFKKQGDIKIVQDVPNTLKASLMRGLFDGDGCFMHERATFVDAHLSACFWFQEELVRHAGIKRAPIIPNSRETSYVVKWSSMERLSQIRDFLYSTPGPFLQRKKDVADQYLVKRVMLS